MTTSDQVPGTDNKCDNCGKELQGVFCCVCGQKDTHYNRSVFKVIGDFFKEMFDFDSRVFSTLSTLFLRPGTLSVEFRDNKRATYVAPIRLYLFSNLVFFFLVAITTQSLNFQLNLEDSNDVADLAPDTVDDSDLTATETSLEEESIEGFTELTAEKIDWCLNGLHEIVTPATFDSAKNVLLKKIIDLDHDPWRERIVRQFENLQQGPRTYLFSNELDLLTREIASAERKHGMMKVLHVAFEEDLETLALGTSIVRNDVTTIHAQTLHNALWAIYTENKDANFANFDEVEKAILKFVIRVEVNWEDLVEDMVENLPLMMFVLLPLFVSILALLSVGKGIRVVFQLIFAMHLHAFIFVTLTFSVLGAMLLSMFSTLTAVIFYLLVQLFIIGHVYLSFKKFYGSGHFVSILKFGLLTAVYVGMLLFSLGVMIVFFAARQF